MNKYINKANRLIKDRIAELKKERNTIKRNLFAGKITFCKYDKKEKRINNEIKLLEEFLWRNDNDRNIV